MKNTTAVLRRLPNQPVIHGIIRHPIRVPTLVIRPATAPICCACAGVAPLATSLVATTVGAQKFEDHSPKMMQAIIAAADQVVRACPLANSAAKPGFASSDERARAGSGMLLRRYAIRRAGRM